MITIPNVGKNICDLLRNFITHPISVLHLKSYYNVIIEQHVCLIRYTENIIEKKIN